MPRQQKPTESETAATVATTTAAEIVASVAGAGICRVVDDGTATPVPTTKPTTTTTTPTPPAGWDRCHFYNERKRRFCKQQINVREAARYRGPRFYCGNHLELYDRTDAIASASSESATDTGEHENGNGNDASRRKRRRRRRDDDGGNERVPCPVDPSHTVYRRALERHVLVCPKAKRCRDERARPYYEADVNRGGGGDGVANDDGPSSSSDPDPARARALARAAIEVYASLFPASNGASSSPESLSREELSARLPAADAAPEEEARGLSRALEQHRVRSGGARHARQQGSLVGHLRRRGLLPSSSSSDEGARRRPATILEMGAGRGALGLLVAGVAAASSSNETSDDDDAEAAEVNLVLVERDGSRFKAEAKIRSARRSAAAAAQSNDQKHEANAEPSTNGMATAASSSSSSSSRSATPYLRLEPVRFHRIRCDLAHVRLPAAVPDLLPNTVADGSSSSSSSSPPSVLVVAKHLCGVGTDLALVSLSAIAADATGCAFATCCHGLCAWRDYVGRPWLREAFRARSSLDGPPFGEADFDALRRWTSGTVHAERADDDDGEHQTDGAEHDDDDDAPRRRRTRPRRQRRRNQGGAVTDDDDDRGRVNVATAARPLSCGVRGLGRACQRVIDYGRTMYMRETLGFARTEMLHYVDETVTPQNCLLVGRR